MGDVDIPSTDFLESAAKEMPRARLASNCQHCCQSILPGDTIFPVEQRQGPRRRSALDWLHYACASEIGGGVPPPVPVCKHYARSGLCQYGIGCFFSHPPEVGAAAASRVREQRLNPNAKVANRGDGRRNYVKNDSRASVMRRWLLDMYGIDALRAGSGIVDVAGGKGELAWELLNLNAVPATVVEPRPLDFKSCRKKWRYGMYWRNPIFHTYLHCQHDAGQNTQTPRHLQMLLLPEVIAWACGRAAADQEDCGMPGDADIRFAEWLSKARGLVWTRKGLHEDSAGFEEDDEKPLEDEDAHSPRDSEASSCLGDGELVTTTEETLETLRACSLFVALHPDQAAEHTIRLALALGKPFAVVPCCVYAAEFPRRRLATGAWVRTYDDLLEYLQGLDSRVKRTDLDFEGKRTVLYMTAADAAASGVSEPAPLHS